MKTKALKLRIVCQTAKAEITRNASFSCILRSSDGNIKACLTKVKLLR